ncbi:MAG: hypothetical protein K2G31_00125 [Clostridia bacterium]|nr:hypothetical protein [Clostridia bacterium]
MYTKCPSCRAELSFLPPPNPESLPEGYKHRIRCPHCGVTIGVKINKVDVQATYPNGYPPAAPQPAPTYPTQPQQQPQTFAPKTSKKAAVQEEVEEKPKKRTGRPRNIMIMILSLLFIVLSALAYKLGTPENLETLPEWAKSLSLFSGISGWELLVKDPGAFTALFSAEGGIKALMLSIVFLFPMFVFTLSGISFILALLGFIFKKYVRVINLIFGILIGGMAVTMLFYPQIITGMDLKEYFQSILNLNGVMYFACAGLGIIYFLFTVLFMKPMKIKNKEEEDEE